MKLQLKLAIEKEDPMLRISRELRLKELFMEKYEASELHSVMADSYREAVLRNTPHLLSFLYTLCMCDRQVSSHVRAAQVW